MKKPRKTDRAAVAKSLRELQQMFGKRPPENDNAAGKSGAGETGITQKGVTK